MLSLKAERKLSASKTRYKYVYCNQSERGTLRYEEAESHHILQVLLSSKEDCMEAI